MLMALAVMLFSGFKPKETPVKPRPDINQIIPLMHKGAGDWNKGDLEAFMSLYDSTTTFMMPSGPVGVAATRDVYVKYYFKDNKPKQNLAYDELVLRPLGENYAMLTGRFILTGNGLPEHKGRYTVVFMYTKQGWKIIHDHSS